jgi:hypothetical protein
MSAPRSKTRWASRVKGAATALDDGDGTYVREDQLVAVATVSPHKHKTIIHWKSPERSRDENRIEGDLTRLRARSDERGRTCAEPRFSDRSAGAFSHARHDRRANDDALRTHDEGDALGSRSDAAHEPNHAEAHDGRWDDERKHGWRIEPSSSLRARRNGIAITSAAWLCGSYGMTGARIRFRQFRPMSASVDNPRPVRGFSVSATIACRSGSPVVAAYGNRMATARPQLLKSTRLVLARVIPEGVGAGRPPLVPSVSAILGQRKLGDHGRRLRVQRLRR